MEKQTAKKGLKKKKTGNDDGLLQNRINAVSVTEAPKIKTKVMVVVGYWNLYFESLESTPECLLASRTSDTSIRGPAKFTVGSLSFPIVGIDMFPRLIQVNIMFVDSVI